MLLIVVAVVLVPGPKASATMVSTGGLGNPPALVTDVEFRCLSCPLPRFYVPRVSQFKDGWYSEFEVAVDPRNGPIMMYLERRPFNPNDFRAWFGEEITNVGTIPIIGWNFMLLNAGAVIGGEFGNSVQVLRFYDPVRRFYAPLGASQTEREVPHMTIEFNEPLAPGETVWFFMKLFECGDPAICPGDDSIMPERANYNTLAQWPIFANIGTVAEPSAVIMLAAGLAGLFWFAGRRRATP